jgi:uncharacterized protein (DUF608 family)
MKQKQSPPASQPPKNGKPPSQPPHRLPTLRNPPGLPRRDFLKWTSLAASGLAFSRMPVMAGPFADVNEYLEVIPEDKRLDPNWVRSLFARGEKEVYTEARALDHVGMPVGGLFAGTVYLSGDGRLWLWNIFNQDRQGIEPRSVPYQGENLSTGQGANYVDPAKPESPFGQGFGLWMGEKERRLDRTGFAQVAFDGRYPVGRVSYRDDGCPLTVELEAYSPFIPLNVDDSALPVTVMSYTVKNTSARPVSCELRGRLENPVALYHRDQEGGVRVNRVRREPGCTMLVCSAAKTERPREPSARPDILFADFESDRYEGWTAEGTAFGKGPVEMSRMPSYQGQVGGQGKRVVNSHASAPGTSVGEKDAATGVLTSKPFQIERNYITFLIGGGPHKGKNCLNLLVDGKVAASATGHSDNRMAPASFRTASFQGRTARLQIVDQEKGPWGNVGLDQIVFSDRPAEPPVALSKQNDFGTMVLAALGGEKEITASARAEEDGRFDQALEEAVRGLDQKLHGAVAQKLSLEPGEAKTATFVLAWHFPNFYGRGLGSERVGHSYAARFKDAAAVARYVAGQWERLSAGTRQWVETWYDSSLPYWLLDRTMANTSTLATTTAYRFQDGRFWAWEGIGCCAGTCTHVWHYAQAPGRLFPEIERITRERVDFGLALHDDGGIGMRAGLRQANEPAHDGQCGRILGVYREHQMSGDNAFLTRLWPRVKKALEYMIRQDGNDDGVVEGAQPNTLDAAWYGKISFLTSLYLAALRAGQALAIEMDDHEFAERCRTIADRGARNILALNNGEYFIQIEDPKHRNQIGVGPGCYIDQVFGQTWAHWVGLERLFDREKQLSALRALWKYNFVPDVGPFRQRFKRGRWYATAGDAGLLMCTWPKGGQNPNFNKHWQYMYFNECMSGFEWQAAAHMIWEGHDQPDLLEHGLAVARAIHDRYSARLRNPYNEIECSDHYARAMASYGAYQAVCGFECHGPKGHLGFAPRLTPEDFKAAFTAANAWGSLAQKREDATQRQIIEVKWGKLLTKTMAFSLPNGVRPKGVEVTVNDKAVPAAHRLEGSRVTVTLETPVTVKAPGTIRVTAQLEKA